MFPSACAHSVLWADLPATPEVRTMQLTGPGTWVTYDGGAVPADILNAGPAGLGQARVCAAPHGNSRQPGHFYPPGQFVSYGRCIFEFGGESITARPPFLVLTGGAGVWGRVEVGQIPAVVGGYENNGQLYICKMYDPRRVGNVVIGTLIGKMLADRPGGSVACHIGVTTV